MSKINISIVGAGYVGLVTGACLSTHNNTNIKIIDTDKEKIKIINNKKSPFYEPELDSILQKHVGKNLKATTRFTSISSANIVFICVGTPQNPDGSTNLSFIKNAASSIGTALQNNTLHCTIVVKSTVPPKTTENIIIPIILSESRKLKSELSFIMNPEFLREGRAIEDFMNPDRIIIGTNKNSDKKVLENLYNSLDMIPYLYVKLSEAEMIKYASNAFLATKISLSNEIGNICKKLNINSNIVMTGVGLDNRIGQMFLKPGVGFGGSCFQKDILALIDTAKKHGENPLILQSVLDTNIAQPTRIILLLEHLIGNVKDKKITILGLAFKNDTDDIRESRSIPVIRELLNKGAIISAYDPMAMNNMKEQFPHIQYCDTPEEALKNSDGCLVMTEWNEFYKLNKEFNVMKNKIIIEGRKILSYKGAKGICW